MEDLYFYIISEVICMLNHIFLLIKTRLEGKKKKRKGKKRLKWNTIDRDLKSFEIEIEIVVFPSVNKRNAKFARKIVRQDVNRQGKHPRDGGCVDKSVHR